MPFAFSSDILWIFRERLIFDQDILKNLSHIYFMTLAAKGKINQKHRLMLFLLINCTIKKLWIFRELWVRILKTLQKKTSIYFKTYKVINSFTIHARSIMWICQRLQYSFPSWLRGASQVLRLLIIVSILEAKETNYLLLRSTGLVSTRKKASKDKLIFFKNSSLSTLSVLLTPILMPLWNLDPNQLKNGHLLFFNTQKVSFLILLPKEEDLHLKFAEHCSGNLLMLLSSSTIEVLLTEILNLKIFSLIRILTLKYLT